MTGETTRVLLREDSYYAIMSWLETNVGEPVHTWYPVSSGWGWRLRFVGFEGILGEPDRKRHAYEVTLEDPDITTMFRLAWDGQAL